jgi:hypothetical protein
LDKLHGKVELISRRSVGRAGRRLKRGFALSLDFAARWGRRNKKN